MGIRFPVSFSFCSFLSSPMLFLLMAKERRKEIKTSQGRCLGGGFRYFLFSPLLGEMIQFDSYFSNGLKPPTSCVFDHKTPLVAFFVVPWSVGPYFLRSA